MFIKCPTCGERVNDKELVKKGNMIYCSYCNIDYEEIEKENNKTKKE